MKKTILILLLAVFSNLASLFAQDRQQAFFVYRNDGDFNVFFFSNVDSITYSKIDVDSILCDEYVTQEVWTEDSVFRIPTAAIGSVAFKPLPTIYKPDVTVISPILESYVLKVDSLTLCLKPSVPQSLLPKVGEKLVTNIANSTLGYSFIGTVKSIENNQDTVKINCERLLLEDIYEQVFITSTVNLEDFENTYSPTQYLAKAYAASQRQSNEPIIINLPTVNIGFTANEKVTNYMANTGLTFKNSVQVKCYPKGASQISFILLPGNEIDFTLSYYNKSKIEWDCSCAGNFSKNKGKEIKVPIEIPTPAGFNVYCELGLGASLEGEVAVDFTLEQEFDASCFIKYNSKYPEGNFKKVNFQQFDILPRFKQVNTVAGKLSGSLYAFCEVGIDIGHSKLDKIGFKAQGGPKVEVSTPLYINEKDLSERSTSSYETLIQDNNALSLNPEIGGSFEFYILEGLKQWLDLGMSIPFNIWSGNTIYYKNFVPNFSHSYFKHDKNGKNAVRTQIENDLVFPVKVGTVVFNEENDNDYEVLWYDAKYENQSSFYEFETELQDLKINKKYIAYPILEWLGRTILATPPVEFSLSATPITGNANDVSTHDAVLTGRIEGDIDMLDENCKYGFIYSDSGNPISSGKFVHGNLNTNGTLTNGLAGLEPGTTYFYCAFIYVNGEYTYGDIVSFTTKEEDEIVDLGLSVKWRGWNLGATTPEGYGDYYAWGETATKVAYSWSTYFDDPYGSDGSWVGSHTNYDISGTELDAATAKLGPEWRMPTRDEMQELIDGCDWTWTQLNGVWGYEVASRKNGNSIFLPAAGNYDGSSVSNAGQYGGYWTGTVGTSESNSQAGNLYFFGETLHAVQWSNRYMGRSIRPVTEQ